MIPPSPGVIGPAQAYGGQSSEGCRADTVRSLRAFPALTYADIRGRRPRLALRKSGNVAIRKWWRQNRVTGCRRPPYVSRGLLWRDVGAVRTQRGADRHRTQFVLAVRKPRRGASDA